jgi:hypothetical protein
MVWRSATLAAMWNPEQLRARLAALAAADPDLRSFGSTRHRYQLGATLSTAEIAAFETEYGIVLPAAYRTFLLEVGDGGAGPYYGLFALADERLPDYETEERRDSGHLAREFPHVSAWNAVELTEHEYNHARWNEGSLIVAEFGCGAFFRLVVSGPARGEVWFDDRAADAGITPVGEFAAWYLGWLNAAGVGRSGG